MRRGVYAGGGLVLALSLALSACGGGAAQPHASVPPLTSASSTPVTVATATAPATPPASGVPPTGAPVGSSSPTAASPTGVAGSAPADPGPSAYPATKAGAQAIIKAAFSALAAGVQTNNVSGMRAVAVASCNCLTGLQSYVAQAQRKHQRVSGADVSVESITEEKAASPTLTEAVVTLSQSAGLVLDAAGKTVAKQLKSAHAEDLIVLRDVAQTWRVLSIQQVKAGSSK